MSTIASHSLLNISETVEAWFQRTTNRKWHASELPVIKIGI